MIELKAFFSHRYKSSEVNLYFHKLFAEAAEVQFEVDVGPTPINVTRLERMVRDSDAFIGIYPFPGDPKKPVSLKDLQNASKYFRLECDLAVRSRKPALVFFDKRYSQVFFFPTNIRAEPFDIQEVTGRGGSPKKGRYLHIFKEFCEEAKASMAVSTARPTEASRTTVGMILPETGPEASRYNDQHIEIIKEVARRHGIRKMINLPWPPRLDGGYLTEIETLDWIIVDVGETAMKSGIIGYLHGRFVPMLRLLKGTDSFSKIQGRRSIAGLFGGVEVGYVRDVVAWKEVSLLISNLEQRITEILYPVERISTQTEAETYFRRAAIRKDAIFLSYSGKDASIASQICAELKKRFQQVFDYRDGESITPGQPWLNEIFDMLSSSALGIPIITPNYLASGNCMHEAQEMVAKRDMGEMALIPVKLNPEDIELPTWMRNRQYLKVYNYPDIETTVEKIIESYDRKKTSRISE